MGVEIYLGMSCSELVYGENGEVIGVVVGGGVDLVFVSLLL